MNSTNIKNKEETIWFHYVILRARGWGWAASI